VRLGQFPPFIRTAYGSMGLLLACYFVSLLVRQPGASFPLIDGWLVAAFEVAASLLCLARVFSLRRGRLVPVVLGAGMLSWSVGDILLTAESAGGAAPSPSVADIFYLGFYPLAYVALVLLVRRHTRGLVMSSWLDGAVAGAGAAAVCACFAFYPILHSLGGDAASVATNLAYPIGDVLLLLLVVGGSAMLPGRSNAQWAILAGACALNAVGDTFNLIDHGGTVSNVAVIFDSIAWPMSILLISGSMWLVPSRTNPLAPNKAASFLLPAFGACAGIGVLFAGTVRSIGGVAIGLATVTMLTAGLRLAISVRRLTSLTEKRHRQAITDDLTGLGNRRQLFQLLNAFFADQADDPSHQHNLSLLYVDLDHFKEINDSFGHAAGDALLRQLGPRLAATLRETDVIVRVGGDELAVLIGGADHQYAASVARRVVSELERPFLLDSVSVRVSASIGIASAPTDAADGAGLLRCADLAMYRAKMSSSSYETYRADLDDGGNRLRMVEELREAVEAGRFDLHYQPLVDLRTGEICALEALVRWPHPRRGQVPSLDFLPLAEEAGLMPALTGLVLTRALAQCAAWRAADRPVSVSVNVSVTNLLDPGFVDSVMAALTTHGVPASSLTLEITETTVIRDFDACVLVIARLRNLGVGVSIDDFGAGFTSLALLGSLPVSELKLDRSFITALGTTGSSRDLALVRATIEMGHALEMRVVAEGVEDRATLDALAGLGCDVAQGYFISHPRLAEDIVLSTAGFGTSRPQYALIPVRAPAV
jgi:diguanylate cyclase (GGDEF)-like protein